MGCGERYVRIHLSQHAWLIEVYSLSSYRCPTYERGFHWRARLRSLGHPSPEHDRPAERSGYKRSGYRRARGASWYAAKPSVSYYRVSLAASAATLTSPT